MEKTIIVATTCIALLVAATLGYIHEKIVARKIKKIKRHNYRQSFVWGYTNSYICLELAIVFYYITFFTYIMYDGHSFMLATLFILLWYFLINRNRWVWLFYTIFITPGFGWIVNGIYLRNRWKEMKYDDNKFRFVDFWCRLKTKYRVCISVIILYWSSLCAWLIISENFRYGMEAPLFIKILFLPPTIFALGIFLFNAIVFDKEKRLEE